MLNGLTLRAILHEDERLLKVRLDARDAEKLNAKAGDRVQVGDPPARMTVRCFVPAQGGVWLWLDG